MENEGRREQQEAAQDEADALAELNADLAFSNANYRRAFTACLEGRGYVVR
jgi:hypothetical protein